MRNPLQNANRALVNTHKKTNPKRLTVSIHPESVTGDKRVRPHTARRDRIIKIFGTINKHNTRCPFRSVRGSRRPTESGGKTDTHKVRHIIYPPRSPQLAHNNQSASQRKMNGDAIRSRALNQQQPTTNAINTLSLMNTSSTPWSGYRSAACSTHDHRSYTLGAFRASSRNIGISYTINTRGARAVWPTPSDNLDAVFAHDMHGRFTHTRKNAAATTVREPVRAHRNSMHNY